MAVTVDNVEPIHTFVEHIVYRADFAVDGSRRAALVQSPVTKGVDPLGRYFGNVLHARKLLKLRQVASVIFRMPNTLLGPAKKRRFQVSPRVVEIEHSKVTSIGAGPQVIQ